MFNYADLFYIGLKEILQVITKTPEPHIQPDHIYNLIICPWTGLPELEAELMVLKSFVLEQFFVKKQSAEKNTAYSLPTPSGDDNNVLIKICMYVFHRLPLK